MKHSALIAVPATLVLALTCTVTAAQDKQMSPNAVKPTTTLSKAAARDAQKTSAQTQDASVRKTKQETEKAGTAAAQPIKPVSEGAYDGCHHSKGSDA